MTHLTATTSRLLRALAVSAVFGTAAFAAPAHAGPIEPIEPMYTVDFRCEEDGAYLEVEVIDDDSFRYDVFIDDVLVVDFESDPDGTPWDFGPYADGSDVFVEIYWYTDPQDETADLLSDGNVFFECSTDDTGVPTTEPAPSTTTGQAGSGANLPSTGGSDPTLALTALALLALGGALLAVRRRPHHA